MFRRKTTNLPDTKAMAAALAAVRAVQNDHDARIMLLVFLDRAALLGRNLKSLKMETDESLRSLFESALAQAKRPLAKVPATFNPDVKPTGKPS